MQRHVALAAVSLAMLAATLLPAKAADVPQRKPGLWEITTIGAGTGTNVVKTCIGQDDKILSPGEGNCSPPKVTSGGTDTTIVDVVCSSGASKETISGAFTGDFATRYRAQVKMTFEPPPTGMPRHLGVTIDGKYLGPNCSGADKP
jgi:uncharacterized protein DUF3617